MTEGARFQQVQPVRLYQRIVEQVEEAILRGELRPGERLPSERELVSTFGASRPTVREALRVLESNGLVRSRPGDPQGPEILPFSPSGLAKQMTRLVHVEGLSISELVAFRMILDGSANLLAAHLRTDEELAVIEQTLEVMERAIDEGFDRFSEADVAFHEAVARASRNPLIEVCNAVVRGVVVSMISDKVTRARNSKALMRRSLGHHREVLEAVRSGDGPEAARISRQNLYDYYAGYVPEVDRAALRALLENDPG